MAARTRVVITHRALELGHGFLPIIDRLKVNGARLPEDAEYYGVDMLRLMTNGVDARELPGIKRSLAQTVKRIKAHPRAKLFTMDARKLEFPDNFFDSVHMVNFLNSSHLTSPFKAQRAAVNEIVDQCIREAHRVLRPGGHLLVVHDLTDVRKDGLAHIVAVGGFTDVTNEPSVPEWFSHIPINYHGQNPIAQWPPLVRVYRKD